MRMCRARDRMGIFASCCWVLGEEYPRRMRKRKEGRSRKMSHNLDRSQ